MQQEDKDREEMIDTVPKELRSGCPSQDLHEEEPDIGIVAFDDVSGAPLDPHGARAARKEEIQYFEKDFDSSYNDAEKTFRGTINIHYINYGQFSSE